MASLKYKGPLQSSPSLSSFCICPLRYYETMSYEAVIANTCSHAFSLMQLHQSSYLPTIYKNLVQLRNSNSKSRLCLVTRNTQVETKQSMPRIQYDTRQKL